ncbi:MAG TPA: MFS transporter [Thermomicrobiales bacterium]|nr:MFS transporter [Thermomicrobiales bacterium]
MRARNPRLALATVIGEGFLGRLAFGMVSFALPLFAYQVGASFTQIGLLVSLRTVVALLLKPAAGALADRFGVRSVYLGGSAGRVLAVAGLLVVDTFAGLLAVRALQGVSAAGRDVGSLSVIVRDAQSRVGSAYSWYSTAKHVGGVGGAAVAGVILTAASGSYDTLFLVVLGLALLPMMIAWVGLKEVPDEAPGTVPPVAASPTIRPTRRERLAGGWALARELSGPGSVAMLVTTSAYMVHGIFPLIATEYGGLTEAQTGLIYTLSAASFLFSGPLFGWLVDRRGSSLGVAWRALANVGSSVLYLVWPGFAGIAVARVVDDSGKAAFRPAWAVTVSRIAAVDPARRGSRLGALDSAQGVGEVVGPLLAGLLWQTGGVALLFGVRIAIAAVAELAALRVFRPTRPAPVPVREPADALR